MRVLAKLASAIAHSKSSVMLLLTCGIDDAVQSQLQYIASWLAMYIAIGWACH
jgi:hypothetical protein